MFLREIIQECMLKPAVVVQLSTVPKFVFKRHSSSELDDKIEYKCFCKMVVHLIWARVNCILLQIEYTSADDRDKIV